MQPRAPKTACNIRNCLAMAATAILLFILGFFWTYKLSDYPGLHADEAWSGIKANYFIGHPIMELTGMTWYTGILEPSMAYLIFSCFKVDVFYLRIGGVLLNLAGMLIVCLTLAGRKMYRASMLFSLAVGASALYLCSPRVAWEVNSFSLFFVSLLFASTEKIRRGSTSVIWTSVWIASGVLGSYNHIIFFAVPCAVFVGSSIWTKRNRQRFHFRLAGLSALCLLDICLVFAFTHFFNDHATLVSISVFLLLLCQSFVFNRMLTFIYPVEKISTTRISLLVVRVLAAFSLSAFLIFHGVAVFEAMSGYKVFLQYYGLQTPGFVAFALVVSWGIFVAYLGKNIWDDVSSSDPSFHVFVLVLYCGLLTALTRQPSFRYYLVVIPLFALYSSIKITKARRGGRVLIPAICAAFLIAGCIQWEVLSGQNKLVRATAFKIGNGFTETSAHFLSKRPVLNFVFSHRIGAVDFFGENPYFLKAPLDFYKLQQPWPRDSARKILIDYDYVTLGTGYLIYVER